MHIPGEIKPTTRDRLGIENLDWDLIWFFYWITTKVYLSILLIYQNTAILYGAKILSIYIRVTYDNAQLHFKAMMTELWLKDRNEDTALKPWKKLKSQFG